MVCQIGYFAHSVLDYNNTVFEIHCLNRIKKFYPTMNISNPKNIFVTEEYKKKLSGTYYEFMSIMEKYYFPEIEKCDILIAFKYSKTGKYTSGVIKEIEYAKSIGKEVIEL